MYELGLVLMGILLGVGGLLGYDIHRMRERIRVLKETAENEEKLRQIGGAVHTLRTYDPLEAMYKQQLASVPYMGGYASGSSTGLLPPNSQATITY